MASPIKISLKSEAMAIFLILISLVASFYFYANFPARVPTHWNINGQPDGYSGRAFAAFFFPALIIGLYLLFLALPRLDPKKDRYREFENVYHLFKNLFVLFLVAIYFIASLAGLGYPVKINLFMPAMIGLLFIVLGAYLPKIKPNWFIGIRTPWTLSSEVVWQKTHEVGGRIFIIAGILMLLMPFLAGELAFIVLMISILILVLYTFIYSYWLYRQEERRKQ